MPPLYRGGKGKIGGGFMPAMLSVKNINKSFGIVHALKDVTFEVNSGEIMGLVGENGAGKSTLVKIITGAYAKDSGVISFNGEEIRKNSTAVSGKAGIAQVYQTAELWDELTVQENICMGDASFTKYGFVKKSETYRSVNELLKKYGMPIQAETQVKYLSSAMKQFVAIARVLYRKPKLIIFDEPTAVLSDNEVDMLFRIIHELKKEKTTMIYISHRLEEIFKLCDRISVMRDGSLVQVMENKNLTKNDLITYMLGKHLGSMYCENRGRPLSDKKVLELEKVTTEKIKNVSFSLREGEILGITGLVGSGRTETAMAIMGVDRIQSGVVRVNGQEVHFKRPSDAAKSGIFLAPEDRKKQAMVLCRPIRENISLSKLKLIVTNGLIDRKKENKNVFDLCRELKVKCASPEHNVQELSGGNQQKVVIAKAFTADPQILIFDEPTQGIDVGAKAEIYILLEKLRNEGKSIIVISSETEEIQGVCDRTIVMRSGQVSGELEYGELSDTQKILGRMYAEV